MFRGYDHRYSYEPSSGRVMDLVSSVEVIVIPILRQEDRRNDRERQQQRERPNQSLAAAAAI